MIIVYTRSFLACLCFFIFPSSIFSQTKQDSILLIQQKWNIKKVQPGLTWTQAHFDNLFGAQQQINIVEIDLNTPQRKLAFAGLSKGLKNTSEFAKENDALAAINATFFDMKNGGSITFLKIGGTVINETTLLNPDQTNHERANGALVIDQNKASIIAGSAQTVGWDKQLPHNNVMTCGPILIQEGQQAKLNDNAFNNNRHPRSAVAITPEGRVILITIDGRNAQSAGMNLNELAFVLRIIGAKDALNLDGGGSTTLYIKKQTPSGIVNYPSDNKVFDHYGERKVANTILVH